MSSTTLILIFTRFPVPGEVKTRLIPALGRKDAAQLHRRMTENTVHTVRSLRAAKTAGAVRIQICYSGAHRKQFRSWLGTDLKFEAQSSGDIGNRMEKAFRSAFHSGADSVLAVGTDIPGLSYEILEKALTGIQKHDVVLGPSIDGGYYLIGMKCAHPELFSGLDWGTDTVCEKTRATIRNMGLAFMELPLLQDMDRPEDLAGIRENPDLIEYDRTQSQVSVVIPTYNEEAVLGPTLERLSGNSSVEIIVADGGSNDRTRDIAAKAGAVVVEVPGGRAIQQNTGADLATGTLLLFLHADTIPPDGFVDLIRNALDNPSTVAGAFRFRVEGSGISMRLLERMTHIRSALFRYPYGDQGLFMEKRVFVDEGGFAPLPIMEDFELVCRLRRRGRIVTLPSPAITSARRWKQLGVLRTTLINQMMIAGFFSGIPIHILERFYRNTGARFLGKTRPTS